MKCWSCAVHQRMSTRSLRCQWNDMKESVHKCAAEWLNQWTNELMNQWINECVSPWINEATKQWLNEPSNQWNNESMNQWTNESVKQRTNNESTKMNQWTNESMVQWINEPMNRWFSETMNQWISAWMIQLKGNSLNANVALATVWCTSCLPKVFRSDHFCICRPHLWNKCSEHAGFCNSYMKSSSGYSIVHILTMSSSRSALGMPVF